MENKRDSWGSNLGFILAAVGSAVGLGNIWGFPYKMGKSGGFTFLIAYLLLAVFVGFVVMISELAMGRHVGKGVIGCYHTLSKKFKWVGWLAVFSPFIIMSFYSVLGGYCIEYMALNMSNFGLRRCGNLRRCGPVHLHADESLRQCDLHDFVLVICYLINRGGISGGIEKFNKVGMPALFVMLVIVIIRSLTLDGAVEGLKFMFVPGYAVEGGFIAEEPNFITVLATAGGQMFFSLSLAMGVMFTYGSYLSKKENLVKNAALIVFSDTLVALMAGLAVIPAAVAISGPSATLSGPKLLFITLQDVFNAMGAAGPLFGVLFYLLVLIAALTSAVSLVEVVTTFFLDRAEEKGKQGNRSKVVLIVCPAIPVEASVVAIDGPGAGGLGEHGQWPAGPLQGGRGHRAGGRHRAVCRLERLLAGLHGRFVRGYRHAAGRAADEFDGGLGDQAQAGSGRSPYRQQRQDRHLLQDLHLCHHPAGHAAGSAGAAQRLRYPEDLWLRPVFP